MTNTSAVVHLVHGTWPFGRFRKKSRSVKAWFEAGSPVRTAIIGAAEAEVDVRTFTWSGRNSVDARRRAAQQLVRHLELSFKEAPDIPHVIIAHSHGGTVAADAISCVDYPGNAIPRIKALVCMATPFAYVRRADQEEIRVFWFALSTLIVSLSLAAYSWLTPGDLWNLLWIPPSSLVLVALVAAIFETIYPDRVVHEYYGRPISPKIPIFVIRATRDEAGLTLGLVQAIEWLISRFTAESGSLLLGVLFFVFAGLFFLPVVLLLDIFFTAKYQISLEVTDTVLIAALLTFAWDSLLFLMGRACMGAAVGLAPKYLPRYMVEVDAAPPETNCTFKSYSYLGEASLTVRHGLYQLPEVQNELGRLIGRVARGLSPRLLVSGELDEEASMTNVVASIKFVHEDQLCWYEGVPSGDDICMWNKAKPMRIYPRSPPESEDVWKKYPQNNPSSSGDDPPA